MAGHGVVTLEVLSVQDDPLTPLPLLTLPQVTQLTPDNPGDCGRGGNVNRTTHVSIGRATLTLT